MKRISVKKKNRKIKIIIIIIVILILFSYLFVKLNQKLKPFLLNYAEIEIKKLATIIINRSVSKQLVEDASTKELVQTEKDEEGNIQSIDFNSIVVNKFLSTMVNSVYLNLKQIEEGNIDFLELPDDVLLAYDEKKLKKGIICEVPIGLFGDYPLLVNLLPKVPVKYHLIGEISGNIHTSVTNYGINNAMLEISIHIKVTMMSLLPLMTDKFYVETDIPLVIRLMQGNVPSYYFGNMQRESANYALPIN